MYNNTTYVDKLTRLLCYYKPIVTRCYARRYYVRRQVVGFSKWKIESGKLKVVLKRLLPSPLVGGATHGNN